MPMRKKTKSPAKQPTKRDDDPLSKEMEKKTMPEDVSQQGSGRDDSSSSGASSNVSGSTTPSAEDSNFPSTSTAITTKRERKDDEKEAKLAKEAAKRAKNEIDDEEKPKEEDNEVVNLLLDEDEMVPDIPNSLPFTRKEDVSSELVSFSSQHPYPLKTGVTITVSNLETIHTVNSRQYTIVGEFGRGTKAVVLRLKYVNHQSSVPELAMKHTSIKDDHQGLIREKVILEHLAVKDKERHIVNYLGYRYPEDIDFEMSLFLEPLTCSLDAYFKKISPRVPHMHIIRFVLKNIMDTVQFIRRNGILHMNINPTNFMVLDKKNKVPKIKLINFDRAQFLKDESSLDLSSQTFDDYSAPELKYHVKPYNNFEIFSVGLIAWRLITGRSVLKDDLPEEVLMNMREVLGPIPVHYEQSKDAETFKKIKNSELTGERRKTNLPINLDQLKNFVPSIYIDRATNKAKPLGLNGKADYDRLVEFIESCLKWDPKDRKTLTQAQSLPFMDATKNTSKAYKEMAESVLRGNNSENFEKVLHRP